MDISPAEFNLRHAKNESFNVIDVREQLEYQTFNFGGNNIPLGKLIKEIGDLEYNSDDEIVVICQRGLRSETAKMVLTQNGYTNVRNLTGGLLALQRLRNNSIDK